MVKRHSPKSIRRVLLKCLYNHYCTEPLDMLPPDVLLADAGISRRELMFHIHYLHDRGLVELLRSHIVPYFSGARITADGIDLVENAYEFALRFPPDPETMEESLEQIPGLVEQLLVECDLSPLDRDGRHALQRDVQFLRDEVARPVARWRSLVIQTVLGWMEETVQQEGHAPADVLPTLEQIRVLLRQYLPS